MTTSAFNKRELLKYIGDISQVFGIREYSLTGGKAQGVRVVEVRTGEGLEFAILPDRCLDIGWLTFKGKNLSYLSKTGIVAPQYYNDAEAEFLRSFFAGFLTTCGLRNVGAACIEAGESLGLHGRISNTPGEQVSAAVEWTQDKPIIRVKGRMREARVFGENLVFDREITSSYGENKIIIEDAVENFGFRKEPLMLLYHFNFGYPLLDEDAFFSCPSKSIRPRDKAAEQGIANYSKFQKPAPDYCEQVFFHDLYTDSDFNTQAAIINEKLAIGVVIRFNKMQMINLVEWKQMGEGEYALGIEPCNCFGGGRLKATGQGQVEYLEPGEVRRFRLEAEILDGLDEISQFKEEIAILAGPNHVQ